MKNLIMAFMLVFLGQFVNGQEMINLWGNDAIGKTLKLAEPDSEINNKVTRLSEVMNPSLKISNTWNW